MLVLGSKICEAKRMLFLELFLWTAAFGLAGWLVYSKTGRKSKKQGWRFAAWVLWVISLAPYIAYALWIFVPGIFGTPF